MNLEFYKAGMWHKVDAAMAACLGADNFWAGFMGDKAGTVRFRWKPTPAAEPAPIPPAQPARCGVCGKDWTDGHPCRATPEQWKAFWAPAHGPDDCPAYPAGCLACKNPDGVCNG